ncbi:hypothetical protein ACFQ9X_13555 [Catenulispora yoronensis]
MNLLRLTGEPNREQLLVGYANLDDRVVDEGVRVLVELVHESMAGSKQG